MKCYTNTTTTADHTSLLLSFCLQPVLLRRYCDTVYVLFLDSTAAKRAAAKFNRPTIASYTLLLIAASTSDLSFLRSAKDRTSRSVELSPDR